MRLPLEAANFKKFFGSQFLSDFNLIIRCEPPGPEPADAVADACHSNTCSPGTGGSELGLQHDADHDLASAGSAAPATPTAAALGTALGSSSAGDALDPASPCSGQHEPGSDEDSTGSHCCSPQQQLAQQATAAAAAATSSPLVKRDSANSLAPSGALQSIYTAHHVAALANTSSSRSNACANGTGSDCSSITIPVHGVVLAAASPYFETLLRDWKSSSNTLHMVVAEEQVSAAQVLLSFMYTSTVPSSLSQHDLLQLLLLADRFDVRRAAAAASRVLGCLSPAALEWSTLTGIWALPDHLFEAEEQAPVRVVAWDRLLQLFGDLEDTWATADGRSLWQQLPLRAVAALAASDALAVASENTVFAALSSWISHAVGVYGRQLSPQELRVLAASVRLPGMGPCYLSYVALQHDWFRQAIDITALARAAAFSAASTDVRKDLFGHSEQNVKQAKKDAAATAGQDGTVATSSQAAVRQQVCTCFCAVEPSVSSSSSSCGGSSIAAAQSGGPWGINSSSGRRCSWCQQQQGCGAEQQVHLLELAQAMQRPRAVSCKRSCFFQWHVDLAAIRQLYEEVAAAGSRDSRILRSPAHSFAGYEWALQLEITQTRGATGFDGAKPWALGVFLTCQVRVEVPNRQAVEAAAVAGEAAAGPGASSSTASGEAAAAAAAVAGDFSNAGAVQGSSSKAMGAPAAQPLPLPLLMQLVDFGFVSTAATISVREVGGKDKRCEKSWDHATVRYRASWGWPNYLDVQANGWDEAAFERWVIDGQMHLQASVRVLG